MILHYIRLCWNCIHHSLFNTSGNDDYGGISLSTLFNRTSRLLLTFDNGMQVKMGKQIAEGGFSYVFEAFPIVGSENNANTTNQHSAAGRLVLSKSSSSTLTSVDNHRAAKKKYALKRINCSDNELVQACRHEAGVHRLLPPDHPNLLDLLGLKFDSQDNNIMIGSQSSHSQSSPSSSRHNDIPHNEYKVCYMLFPYIPHSLRGEITQRHLLHNIHQNNHTQSGNSKMMHRHQSQQRRPFATKEIIELFGGLIDALAAMHDANISHRDVKLENILLRRRNYGDDDDGGSIIGGGVPSSSSSFAPVVMDFGSAGPLTSPPLTSRKQVSTVVEQAAMHTTVSYRPPELFEGGMRHGPREVLDYQRVDVW